LVKLAAGSGAATRILQKPCYSLGLCRQERTRRRIHALKEKRTAPDLKPEHGRRGSRRRCPWRYAEQPPNLSLLGWIPCQNSCIAAHPTSLSNSWQRRAAGRVEIDCRSCALSLNVRTGDQLGYLQILYARGDHAFNGG